MSAPHTHDHAPTVAPAHHGGGASEVGIFLRMTFVAMAVIMVVFGHGSPEVTTFAVIFVSIVLEAIPFMLLGSLISGLIEVFISKDRLASILPKRTFLTTLIAASAGLIFPVCECAIVPVVRRFLRKGIPLSAAIAYLLAGPIFNPVVGASTAVAYATGSTGAGWLMVAIRLGAGLVVAVGVGLVIGRLGARAVVVPSDPDEHTHDHHAPPGTPLPMRVLASLRHGADEFLDVGQYLIIGAFVAAPGQTLITRQGDRVQAAAATAAIQLKTVMAVLLNLCSEADAFVAASFRTTLPMSAQMGFMVLGPMLDLKLIAMYLGVFRKRAIVVIAVVVFLSVFALMALLHMAGADADMAARGIGPEVTS